MCFSTNQPVVSPWQCGIGRGENNVVAAGVPAGKQCAATCRHADVKLGLPAGCQAHLLAIQAVAKAGQPGALVRGAYRHDVVDARVGFHSLQPGARGQPAHRVADQQWRQTRGISHLLDSGFNLRSVVIYRGKDGLQAERHKRMAAALQAFEPGVPEAPVAEKAMNKYYAALTFDDSANCHVVGNGMGTKRLAPAKNARCHQRLAQPGFEYFCPGSQGGWVGFIDVPEQ